MPTTLAGLAVFAALLTPGFAYIARRERRFPSQQHSALRETAAVVTVSLACDTATIVAFGILRSIWPAATPDVGRLAREGNRMLRLEYVSIGTWCAALIAAATALAFTMACPPKWFLASVVRVSQLSSLRKRGGLNLADWAADQQRRPIQLVSGWCKAFQLYRDSYVWVTCDLIDDRVVGGWLLSANPQTEETDDRSIVLTGTLRVRGGRAADTEFTDMTIGTLVIPARQIRLLSVSYFDSDASPPY